MTRPSEQGPACAKTRRRGRPVHAGVPSRSQRPLWCLSITVSPEAEEAVSELMTGILGCPVCSYSDLKAGLATVSAFFDSKEVWYATAREKIADGLHSVRRCGLSIGPGKISFAKLQSHDWADAWKRHFKPLNIGSALVVRPSWSRVRLRPKQRVVVLDPGLSFGTGQHPTTRFCLQQLVAQRPLGGRKSLLDLGTGSGILAISAAKLGFHPVVALDFDSDAISIAAANARRNGVWKRIEFRQEDVTKLARHTACRYSVICANLITPLLIEQRERIINRLAPDGLLVLAGILSSEFKQLQHAYQATGFRLIQKQIDQEWCSGSFAKLPTGSPVRSVRH